MNEMEIFLYGGVIATALVTGVWYRLRCKKGQCEQNEQIANKINDFYTTQDKQTDNFEI